MPKPYGVGSSIIRALNSIINMKLDSSKSNYALGCAFTLD